MIGDNVQNLMLKEEAVQAARKESSICCQHYRGNRGPYRKKAGQGMTAPSRKDDQLLAASSSGNGNDYEGVPDSGGEADSFSTCERC
jgi:hypothetical protein